MRSTKAFFFFTCRFGEGSLFCYLVVVVDVVCLFVGVLLLDELQKKKKFK